MPTALPGTHETRTTGRWGGLAGQNSGDWGQNTVAATRPLVFNGCGCSNPAERQDRPRQRSPLRRAHLCARPGHLRSGVRRIQHPRGKSGGRDLSARCYAPGARPIRAGCSKLCRKDEPHGFDPDTRRRARQRRALSRHGQCRITRAAGAFTTRKRGNREKNNARINNNRN